MQKRTGNVQNQRGRAHLFGPATYHLKKTRTRKQEAAQVNKMCKEFGFVIVNDLFHQCHEIKQSPLMVFCIFFFGLLLVREVLFNISCMFNSHTCYDGHNMHFKLEPF